MPPSRSSKEKNDVCMDWVAMRGPPMENAARSRDAFDKRYVSTAGTYEVVGIVEANLPDGVDLSSLCVVFSLSLFRQSTSKCIALNTREHGGHTTGVTGRRGRAVAIANDG